MAFIIDILSYVWWVLLAIMILVFVHEMGHFLFAKLFKMRVDRFSVGFPPKVVGFTKGETEYVLGLTPLGGYVKIAGMVDESMDTDELASEPQPHEFRAKPVWQRIVVITAGVIFNMILAAFIYMGLKATYGEAYVPPVGAIHVADSSLAYEMGMRTGDELVTINERPIRRFDRETLADVLTSRMVVVVDRDGQTLTFYGPSDIMTRLSESDQSQGFMGLSFDPPLVGQVLNNSPADAAGWQEGDRIVAINGQAVQFFADLREQVQSTDGGPISVTLLRTETPEDPWDMTGSQRIETTVVPEEEADRYVVGVFPQLIMNQYSLPQAITAGIMDTWYNTKLIAVSLKRVFTGQEDFRKNVGGPVMIAKATKEAAEGGPYQFWNIVAMLSITLAIINILPIPALDGGHLVFLIYEGITRREPSLKFRMVTQQIGMLVLLVFMTFLIFNDILRL